MPSTENSRALEPTGHLDVVLAAQLAVAWAGEAGEEPRLGWWKSDLVSEFGGHDLFQRLLPHTWEWAALEGAREAARRRDAELRAKASRADRIVSLFHFGFERDERIEERLREHKRSGATPRAALPALADTVRDPWSADAFTRWLEGHGRADYVADPVGRRLAGVPTPALDALAARLLAALTPLGDQYPLPHYPGVK